MEFTPGPWEVYEIPGGEIGIKAKLMEFETGKLLTFFVLPTAENISFKLNAEGELWGSIAYTQWVQFAPPGWEDKQKANAILIATAPKLLKALEGLLDMVTDNRTHGPEVDAAADVIYKARGE